MPYNLLKQKNSYFKNLSSEAQEVFVARIYNFMADKSFNGREGLVITDEIKVLISASAIQLTFGLKDYMISHLSDINVFPHIFFSNYLKTNLKGLNTQNGILSLSWNDFKEGYATDDDKLNLGLHELTHALNIDLDIGGNYDEHFSVYFRKWEMIAAKDYNDLKEKRNTFLRSYGGTNMHEFLAVCVEHFFEVPKEFKKQLPHLYNFLMLMLNQDPDNITDDYKVRVYPEKDLPVIGNSFGKLESDLNEQILNNSYNEERYSLWRSILKRNGIYIAMAATFFGLFGGLPLLIWFWSTTIISIGAVFIIFFICGALGLLQWKYVKEYLEMEYHQFSMYAFSGFGMCLINIIFLLNTFIPIHSTTLSFDIVTYKTGNQGVEITLSGEGNSSALERNVASYFGDNYRALFKAKKITVYTSTGIFGMDRIKDCEFVY